MGTVSMGWPCARADRRVVLPEFSSPMTTISSFLVKKISSNFRRTWPMIIIYQSNWILT